ncbi:MULTISPECIES: hydrogen peroxide-dependent heme synthase [unclassified Actinotalea]|uniref:hydrogen peroxide-dependent heme synthase n=1 Tax=unclassified Actinotalea TaxID=2638618 RepID=UPI0015F5938E|nr:MULTISPECIES: hydrogen peroxide-dependent heme synthase [unclassified Actinotalea]
MTSPATPPQPQQHGSTPGAWTLWTVLGRPTGEPRPGPTAPPVTEAAGNLPDGVVLRGAYDVSGLRAGADLLVWLHGDAPEDLQRAARTLRRSQELAPLVPVWSGMGVHRPAEFARDHQPAYMRDTEPKPWFTLYPFVRSYEWYLLPADERRAMLIEHGVKGRDYPQVLSNTVASFALGDYEWLLAFEADELTELVDLMRHLRETEARRHVREEVPFFTGRRIELDEITEVIR